MPPNKKRSSWFWVVFWNFHADALAELVFDSSLFYPAQHDSMIQFRLSQIFEMEWFHLNWENRESGNKTFRTKIKKSIKYFCAVENRIYNMIYIRIHLESSVFLRSFFFFYCCIFICENGCRQSMANSLVSHKQREHVFGYFYILHIFVRCGSVVLVSQNVFSQN